MDFLDVVGAQYVNSVKGNPYFESIVDDHYAIRCQDQLIQCLYPSHFQDALPVQYDEIMRIFERNSDDVLAFDAETAAEWIDCDFSNDYLVGGDVGESIVGGGVEEW